MGEMWAGNGSSISKYVRTESGKMGFLYSKLSLFKWTIDKYLNFYSFQLKNSSSKTFVFVGNELTYNRSFTNLAYSSERSIELPIIINFLKQNNPSKILEVGNVLNHYFSIPHVVVDKYEIANGIINKDIVDYCPDTKFDMIICISTLEHVGFDEPAVEEVKTLTAIQRMHDLLAPNGKIIITVPLGHNPYLDKFLINGTISFPEMHLIKRISSHNTWEEQPLYFLQTEEFKYNYPYQYGNWILILHN